MCGIAGKVFLGRGAVTQKDLKAMGDKIAHRGPDDHGYFVSRDRKVGLVNRRLAIIDLSSKGHQPMSYKGRYWVTFNGEIYNFQEERKKLEKEGYRFKSKTDTEVILALYDKYGVKCLNYLRGMFAFVIYDEKEKTLFLARDRLGKKPLKYFFDRNLFLFASELKAILTQKEVSPEPDLIAIHHYLTYGYVPPPMTGFTGLKKLEPGYYLLLDLKSGRLTKERYWKADFNKKLDLTEGEWCERILATLEEATRLRMIADVPLGAYLSGGVDSSAVVAMMAKLSPDPVKTFTIGFKEKTHDETRYARNIAKKYQTDHTELMAEPESVEILPELIRQFEEPYANSSFIVSYLVAKLAREKVTVVLNGDGGDENFGGYDSRHFRLRRDVILEKYGPLLSILGLPLARGVSWPKAVRFLEKRKTPLPDRYLSYNSFLGNDDKEKLYTRELRDATAFINSYEVAREKFRDSQAAELPDRALYYDLSSHFPEDLLMKVDLSSMLVSLEARSPFTDQKMVELAAQIPFNLKVKGGVSKYILKKALEEIVPKENLYRPKKGFSVPLGRWFSGSLRAFAASKLLGKSRTANLFDQKEVRAMLAGHSRENDLGLKLWALLALELWWREFFD